MLSDGDVFLFGGAEGATMNCKTIWAMFTNRPYDEEWKVVSYLFYGSIFFQDTVKSCPDIIYQFRRA